MADLDVNGEGWGDTGSEEDAGEPERSQVRVSTGDECLGC